MTARAGKACHALTEAEPSQRQSSSPPSQRSFNSRHCNYNRPTDRRTLPQDSSSVRGGSAQHREPSVLSEHKRSPPANENRRSHGIDRHDLGRRGDLGPGSNPSSNCRMPYRTRARVARGHRGRGHPRAELVAVAATPSEVRPSRRCPRSLLKLADPDRLVTQRRGLARSNGAASRWSRAVRQARTAGPPCQASAQAWPWRVRPRASSRRRLTAATRSDHHRSLRSMPR